MEIHHKGFFAKVLYTSSADIFYGEAENGGDVIVFQAKTLEAASITMREAVNQYIDMINSQDEKTSQFSSKFSYLDL